MYKKIILSELNEAMHVLNIFKENHENIISIQNAAFLISNAFKNGGKILSCGNGGSHCDAMHFTEELTGFYRNKRKGYPAISISDVSYISCVSNDIGYEYIFSRYIETLGSEKDVLLSLSTSGNSNNIIKAIEVAKKHNIKTITLTGNKGGTISKMSDINICISHFRHADRIQEMHIKILHILVLLIEIEMQKK